MARQRKQRTNKSVSWSIIIIVLLIVLYFIGSSTFSFAENFFPENELGALIVFGIIITIISTIISTLAQVIISEISLKMW